jgi:hypothetical protein
LESTIIYEKSFIDIDGNRVILNVYPMMKGGKNKVEKPTTNTSKSRE